MELIREILASHESGISRDGLLAWARLRGDPKMTDEQLDAVLAELGDEVVDVQGFLYLRRYAPASARDDTGREAAATAPGAASDGTAGAPPPWPPPAMATGAPAWPPPPTAPGGGTASAEPSQGEGWATPEGGWTPPEGGGSRRTMIVAAVGVFLFLAVAGAATAILRGTADEAPAETPAVPTPTSGAVVGALTLELGDCVILPTESQFEEIRKLECTEPHDGEVFLLADHPGPTFPSEEEFSTWVEAQCLPAFEAFTGSTYEGQSVLDVGWFTPTEASWDNGDREVACYLTPLAGTTSQSWQGANP